MNNMNNLSDYIEDQLVNKRKSPILIPDPNSDQRSSNQSSFLSLETVQSHLTDRSSKQLDLVMATIPTVYPPSSLSDFQYEFNDKGELRHMQKADEPFHFVSQRHYEAIGDFIAREIQLRMIRDCGLREVLLPGVEQRDPIWISEQESSAITAQDQQTLIKNNVFVSQNWQTADKLMLLIQGSGAVRAGQWARALCMNESLETGSQIPYIQQALLEGYGVIVFNPNLNRLPKTPIPHQYTREGFMMTDKPSSLSRNQYTDIPEHDSPPIHTISVWDNIVSRAQAKDIVIVAHSAGGYCTMSLLQARHSQVLPKLRGVAFTDSVHSVMSSDPKPVRDFICQNAINWVTSDRPLDTLIQPASSRGCCCLSAGHTKHENTSASCQTSAFAFLARKIQEAS